MSELLKRLEIIKSSIAVNDIELIEFQLPKIEALTQEDAPSSIINELKNGALSSALELIDEYLRAQQGLVVYSDLTAMALKMELKQLEKVVEELHLQRDEMMYVVEQFEYRYQERVGGVIRDILHLQHQIQTIYWQKKQDEYLAEKAKYREEEKRLNQLKQKIQQREQELESIDPFENAKEYEELEKEIEGLEEEFKQQRESVKAARKKTQDHKQQMDESLESERYQETKQEYEEFNQAREDVLQEERFQLDKEQEQEMKKLFRKAAKLCHPDLVDEASKPLANEIMGKLNEAKKKHDIATIRSLLEKLEHGVAFEVDSNRLSTSEQLKAKISELSTTKTSLEEEISEIEQSDAWKDMPAQDGWEEYFLDIETQLKVERIELESELNELTAKGE